MAATSKLVAPSSAKSKLARSNSGAQSEAAEKNLLSDANQNPCTFHSEKSEKVPLKNDQQNVDVCLNANKDVVNGGVGRILDREDTVLYSNLRSAETMPLSNLPATKCSISESNCNASVEASIRSISLCNDAIEIQKENCKKNVNYCGKSETSAKDGGCAQNCDTKVPKALGSVVVAENTGYSGQSLLGSNINSKMEISNADTNMAASRDRVARPSLGLPIVGSRLRSQSQGSGTNRPQEASTVGPPPVPVRRESITDETSTASKPVVNQSAVSTNHVLPPAPYSASSRSPNLRRDAAGSAFDSPMRCQLEKSSNLSSVLCQPDGNPAEDTAAISALGIEPMLPINVSSSPYAAYQNGLYDNGKKSVRASSAPAQNGAAPASRGNSAPTTQRTYVMSSPTNGISSRSLTSPTPGIAMQEHVMSSSSPLGMTSQLMEAQHHRPLIDPARMFNRRQHCASGSGKACKGLLCLLRSMIIFFCL